MPPSRITVALVRAEHVTRLMLALQYCAFFGRNNLRIGTQAPATTPVIPMLEVYVEGPPEYIYSGVGYVQALLDVISGQLDAFIYADKA